MYDILNIDMVSKNINLKDNLIFKKDLRGHNFTFHSTFGLFSPKDIDEGTKILIDNIDVGSNDISLDLGCGYGPIGLVVAKLSPLGVVHMVDKDFVAIDYAKKNAEVNGIKNCEIYLSNGFSNISNNIKFNNIMCNVPAKVGKELYWIIMNDAKQHLKENGKLYFVFIHGLKEFFRRYFKEIFGNYTHIINSKTYTVGLAINK